MYVSVLKAKVYKITTCAIGYLKVHQCRFENLGICLCFYKYKTPKISRT